MSERQALLDEIDEHLRAESEQDLATLLKGMTDDCFNYVVADPKRQMYAGPEAVTERYQNLWRAFPDLEVVLRRVVAVGDNNIVVTENQLSGTHEGSLFGVPATGHQVSVETCVVWEFRDAEIHGETVYFDLATMLRQVGRFTALDRNS